MGIFSGLTALANPERFMSFSRPMLWVTGVLAILLLITGSVWALFYAPPDYQMGESVRIMYVHVPAAWMTMAAYCFMVVASFVGFVWRHQLADVAAREAAPIGLVFCILALITGGIWGKITWGVWWDWDARMTSVLVLAFIYAGYIALWQAIDNEAKAARMAAILCFVGAINVPIIKFSVEFWGSLHQKATVITSEGPKMPAEMLWPLLIMALGYTALFGYFVLLRLRTILRERKQERSATPARPVTTVRPMTASAAASTAEIADGSNTSLAGE